MRLITQLFTVLPDWPKWFGQLNLSLSTAPHPMQVFNEHGRVFRTYYRLMRLQRGQHSCLRWEKASSKVVMYSCENINSRLFWRRSYLNETGTKTAKYSFIQFAFGTKKWGPTAHYLRKCKLLLCQISLKPSPAPLFTASNRGIYLYCVAPDVCLLKLIHMSLGKVCVYQMDNWF